MGRPVTKFEADDGSIHDTEAEMDARDELLRGLARIEAFIAAESNWPRGEASRARRLIAAFLAYERGQKNAPEAFDSAMQEAAP